MKTTSQEYKERIERGKQYIERLKSQGADPAALQSAQVLLIKYVGIYEFLAETHNKMLSDIQTHPDDPKHIYIDYSDSAETAQS